MNERRASRPAGVPAIPQRILVVDGDHRVRDSLAGLIALADGVQVVGTTSQLNETLEAVDRLRPEVVVIDPYLPDLADGIGLIGRLRATTPSLRIVATCHDHGSDVAAIAAGADAYVDQDADPAAFHEAVLAAARPRADAERQKVGPRTSGPRAVAR